MASARAGALAILCGIRITSEEVLTHIDHDIIVDAVCNTAWKMQATGLITVHEVIESVRFCHVQIEGSRPSIAELALTLADSLPYMITVDDAPVDVLMTEIRNTGERQPRKMILLDLEKLDEDVVHFIEYGDQGV